MYITIGWCVVLLIFQSPAAAVCCPHEDATLEKFSEVFTQYNKSSDIVITKAVLLDVSLLDVNTVEVTGSGKLVFNQGHDITVKVKGIYVRDDASLIIGSELCRHRDNVRIVLQGTRTADRSQLTGAGEKYITVVDRGTLHVYGEDKLAWTKLSETVHEEQYAANHIYRHRSSSDAWTMYWVEGLSMYVLDANLNKKSFTIYDILQIAAEQEAGAVNAMKTRLNEAVNGDVVAISVHKSFTHKNASYLDSLYDELEQITGMTAGDLLLRKARMYDAFSLVFVKGGAYGQALDRSMKDKRGGVALASIEVKGKKVTAESIVWENGFWQSFIDLRVLTPEVGYPEIRLVGDISSWRAGDKILLTSTDYRWFHAEVRTIKEVTGPNSLRLSDELAYRHFGEIENGVDMRAEVALLSRNVKIEGEMSRDCPPSNGNCGKIPYDTYGGHIKIIKGFGSVVIDGAELENMGQATDMGFYPIHFHMCLDITGKTATIRRNSIHHTHARAITVHGTYGTSPSEPGVKLKENVAYMIAGHAYFLEDGIERATVMIDNLAASIHNIANGFVTDETESAAYWITTPETLFVGNVAAGGEGKGIWYVFPDDPVGASAGKVYAHKEASRTPIWTCDRNVAHSHFQAGFFFDGKVLNNLGAVDLVNEYKPVQNPLDDNSPTVQVQIVRLTAYKNFVQNTWIGGGQIEVIQYSSAESMKGLQFVTTNSQTQSVKKSIFVGRSTGNTENDGYPDMIPSEFLNHYIGMVFYYGPVYLESSYFTNFEMASDRSYASTAIGFQPKNKFNSSPGSSVKNVRFSYQDTSSSLDYRVFDGNRSDANLGFGNEDGDEGASIRDLDGSVTRCPGDTSWSGPVTLVKPEKYVLTENCVYREKWQMAQCTDRFGKMQVNVWQVFSGTPWTFDDAAQARRRRFDDPDDVAYEDHSGETINPKFLTVLGNNTYYYEFQYKNSFPKQLDVRGDGVEPGYSVVVGVCLPAGSSRSDLDLSVSRPDTSWWGDNSIQMVNSLAEVAAATEINQVFLDGRMLYVKLQSSKPRDPDWRHYDTGVCPGKFCPGITVTLKTFKPYTPCFNPSQEELGTDIFLAGIPRENCGLAATGFPDADWGAGDQLDRSRDGDWGEWSPWSKCDPCEEASQRTRIRVCDNPPRSEGGADCPGSANESMPCDKTCVGPPANGAWSQWGGWSECFCDGIARGSGGVKISSRECAGAANGGRFCEGVWQYATTCEGDCGFN